MSELIHGKEERQEILKDIIRDLHSGKTPEEVKEKFAKLIKNVSPTEISEMEDSLIKEGLPEKEVKRLCDVHVAVFKESLDERLKPGNQPGHPVHTFQMENEEIQKVIASLQEMLDNVKNEIDGLKDYKDAIKSELELLSEINKHYLRKENQLFPMLEKKGVHGPPKVMWQIHDDVRALLKEVKKAVENDDSQTVVAKGEELLTTISELIYKEENILFPMSLETLSTEDWIKVRQGEEEIGYAFVTPGNEWKPAQETVNQYQNETTDLGELQLDTGSLSHEAINLILTHLPVDLTFVDENDQVKYYSQGPHRVFPRSPGIIGRNVENCHPVSSVHVVGKIVEEFKQGTKDKAEFWLQMNERFIFIQYFAVRDKEGKYRGVVEVTQDVTEIRALEGQKRILDW